MRQDSKILFFQKSTFFLKKEENASLSKNETQKANLGHSILMFFKEHFNNPAVGFKN